VKSAYPPAGATGTSSCFDYVLTGSSGGNEVRIAFTQSADTTGIVSPYLSIPAFTNGKSGTVCMSDVSCNGQMNCPTPGASAYDIQIQVVGGNAAGTYNVCLTSLKPSTTGTTYSQECGAQGATNSHEAVGKYTAQNDVSSGTLCMTPNLSGTNASFTVDSATLSGTGVAAYPSLVDGWHYGLNSSDTALPKLVSALTTVPSSVTYTTGSNGKYDAAYDIWVLPGTSAANVAALTTPANGLEVMLWLNDAGGVVPAGNNKIGTFTPTGGATWDEYSSTVSTWKYIAFVKTGQTTFSGDLAPFIKEAVTKSALGGTPYLAGIEYGFELYSGQSVTGMAVTSFSSTVN
jgi:hypothetical protein